MQFAERQPVLLAQHRLRKRGRTCVGLGLAVLIAGAERLEPGRQQRGGFRRPLRLHHPRDAIAPLARAHRFIARQIVAADARVRV